MKSVVMDIVVADVAPKFGMLFSRSWIKRLGGTLEMDLTYATILVFGGEHRRLYREAQLAYIISDEANPTNHPIFSLDTDLGSSLLQLTNAPKPLLKLRQQPTTSHEISPPVTSVWKIFFDGASSREGTSAAFFFVSPAQETVSLSYKLEFETTNNVAEYEALVLGLRATKEMGIQEVAVFRDEELIVQQIINTYQAKHPRIRSYRNGVWDLIDSFFLEFNISFIPREKNIVDDSLATSASNFKVPLPPKVRYYVEVKYRPSIPDNFKHWKVLEDDLEIKIFLDTVEEFLELHIDQDLVLEAKLDDGNFLSKIAKRDIVELPNKHIPKGLVPLERIFDRNYVALKEKILDDDVDTNQCNIGTENEPKFVKLSRSPTKE
jgi:ribonuclease HI